jgi:transcriptional regulator with GAF, ATPase, and Fis domain
VLPSDSRADVLLLGESAAIRAIDADIECAARSDAKVLITGETGVGKEVVAQLIHRRSGRANHPLVTLNCAGVPETLLESELFGHVRGSFTDAYRDKKGLLETSSNGTLFLDEVGEMSLRMQAVLLRFLETGEIQRVGADRSHARVNVRLIAATNRDLKTQIAAGAFREDLYFRLNVIRISIPPLRDRADDVPLLANHFLITYCQQHRVTTAFSPEALHALSAYSWPGNVRELRNAVERLVLKARGATIGVEDLPSTLMATNGTSHGDGHMNGNGASRVHELATRMLVQGESFWEAVVPPFTSHELSRADLRKIVQLGLERTQGSYHQLVRLFNMPDDDHGKFLNFLRKNDCHLPFQGFRAVPARAKRSTGSSAAIEKA